MNHQVIIIASLGRCGSTMLFDALFNARNFIIDLHNIFHQEKYTFIKTHDFAPAALPDNAKVIFLFGNVTDIVLSSHNEPVVNVRQHYIHLHGRFDKKSNYIYEDTLRLEENFDSWHKKHEYPVMTVRYEKLWENIKQIEKFVGFSFSLPAFQSRRPLWAAHSHHQIETISYAYASLIQKINNAPDIKLWN